jgi:hypothetical protein
MKKWTGLFLVAAVCFTGGAAVAASHYITGMEVGDDDVLTLTYNPLPLNEGKNLDRMVKGELDQDALDRFNEHRLHKLGKLEIETKAKIGDSELEAGEYTVGLSAKEGGKFAFVVWTGEGEEKTAQETPLELKKIDETVKYMAFSLQPAWEGSGQWLGLAYGGYAAAIPVSVDGLAEDAEVKYLTGIAEEGDDILEITYNATPYNEGETFEKMRAGDENMPKYFNDSPKFGKVGTFEVERGTTVGTLDAPPGEYPCGINVDAEGNFTYVGWDGDDKHSTKIELVEHEMVVPHLVHIVTPAGTEGSNLRVIYGKYHADIPIGLGGAEE